MKQTIILPLGGSIILNGIGNGRCMLVSYIILNPISENKKVKCPRQCLGIMKSNKVVFVLVAQLTHEHLLSRNINNQHVQTQHAVTRD